MDNEEFRKWIEEQKKIFIELLEPIRQVSPEEYKSNLEAYFRYLDLSLKANEGKELTNSEINEILDQNKQTKEFIERWKKDKGGLIFPTSHH